MFYRTLTLIAILICCTTPAFADVLESTVAPGLKKYCVGCHGTEKAEGKLRVDQLTADFSNRDNAAAWIEIRNMINLGEMPPADAPQPPIELIVKTSDWIADGLRATARERTSTEGRVLLRRLNRHEYTNTIADLLGMKFPAGESPLDVLPPDGTAEGFDKVSTALLLDPSLMTHYYQVARNIADRAIADGPPEYPTEIMRLEYEEMANSRAIGYLVRRLGMTPVPDGLELVEGNTRSYGMLRYPGRRDNNVAPVNGFYRFTIRAGGARGSDGEVPRIQLTHNHPDDAMELIMEVDVTALLEQPTEYSVVISRDTLGNELNVSLINAEQLYMSQRPGENFMSRNRELGEKGDFAEVLRMSGRKIAEGWGGDRSTPDPEKRDTTQYPRVFLDYLEVEGPLYDQWPPKSHSMLLFRGDDGVENLEYAREIFARFLPQAWRRPVDPIELEPVLKVVQTELDSGESFHEAIRIGLSVVLTSPKFLYIVEPSIEPSKANENQNSSRELNDFELASRLSYFLWSSMPDAELFKLADAKQLNDPATLSAQVDRMLADPKSQRFVDGFARQWLRTDTFLSFKPDRQIYREYDDKLSTAVVREPLEFFRTVLHNDLSIRNFIDSDFLVINDRLAMHYGIAGVVGEDFQRVPVPADSPRGGLLGMAGVHQAGSDGSRTKPISRAVYVREVLFNNPPGAPPPNAGEIEPNIKGERLTVRERLIQHQQIEACAACHRSLDPYGLAMENFNAIGEWREFQDGENFRRSNGPPIDPSGRLPNGSEFSTFAEFRGLLLKQHAKFRRALAQKMFVYALGRPTESSDDTTISAATESMARGDDTLRTLIKSLVTSKAFVTK